MVEQRLHDAPGLLDAVLPGEVFVVADHRGMQQRLVWLRRVAPLAGERGAVRRGGCAQSGACGGGTKRASLRARRRCGTGCRPQLVTGAGALAVGLHPDAAVLPFVSASFDLVVSRLALSNIRQAGSRPQALR